MNLVQELFDAILACDRIVVEKRELGHPPEPQAGTDAPAQKGRGAIQGARRIAPRGIVAEQRVVHPCELQVWCDVHACERDKSDTWVVDLSAQQLRELGAEVVAHASGAETLGP